MRNTARGFNFQRKSVPKAILQDPPGNLPDFLGYNNFKMIQGC